MIQRDYYWEYLQINDNLLYEFTAEVKIKYPFAFHVNGVSIEKGIINWLWDQVMYQKSRRQWYNTQRLNGQSQAKVYNRLKKWFQHIFSGKSTDYQNYPFIYSENEEIQILKHYTHQINILCRNSREWEYWKPIIKYSREKMIIWCDFVLKDEEELSDDILLIELVPLKGKYFHNLFLENLAKDLVPIINHYVLLLNILSPSCMLILTGCNAEGEILNALCKGQQIPSICVQQGWPSIIHSKFQKMEYDYFLTWGESFNNLWKKYNPMVKFIASGYPYPTSKEKKDRGITFFLQHPVITLNNIYENEMLELIHYCIQTFPEKNIYIREHPAIPLPKYKKESLQHIPNLHFVSNLSLEKVFALTEISVSYFSSTIVESLVHDVIPFIFDPSSAPGYYPNLSEATLGIEAKTIEEGKQKIHALMTDEKKRKLLKDNIIVEKNHYFIKTNKEAIAHILSIINQLKSISQEGGTLK